MHAGMAVLATVPIPKIQRPLRGPSRDGVWIAFTGALQLMLDGPNVQPSAVMKTGVGKIPPCLESSSTIS